jgi:DNA-binding beta-propeller fold protein YncE
MQLQIIKYILFITFLLNSCTYYHLQVPPSAAIINSNYPINVGTIIINKCAIAGCHNNISYPNAANLNLSTWDGLFIGSVLTGSVVIPYRADFSSFCYFTNTDSSLGVVSLPTMPQELPPLTRNEYLVLRNWIDQGAPSAKGDVKFSGEPARRKFYVTNRMCNVVTAIDESSLLQMEYTNVGNDSTNKYPYCIKVAPDKKNWYVSFFSRTSTVQKFDAITDQLIGNINIRPGLWTSFVITSDSKYGYFADNSSPGQIAYVDLEHMSVLAIYTFSGNFQYLNGMVLNEKLKKLYAGTLSGNFIYVIDISNPLTPIIKTTTLDGTATASYSPIINPIDLIADTNTDICYIACQQSNDIRVVDMKADTMLAAITLGSNPAFLAYSATSHILLASCPDDMNSFPRNRGSVAIIDTKTNTFIKRLNTGYQPYGLIADDQKNIVAVVNSNISGPGSHHASGCGTKNGNLSFIDLNTLELIPEKQLILAVFPFAISLR